MKTELAFVVVLAVLGGLAADSANAQRGAGQAAGVAVQSVKPDVVSLSGKVQKIDIGPCQNTTGRAITGVHFILETPKAKKLNVHLGPEFAVDFVTDRLSVGKKVTVDAFRTDKMAKNHYVAQVVTVDGKSIRLRDASLQPVWARGNAAMRGRGGPAWGRGRGQGPGYGRGWGQGPAPDRGYSPRPGPGYGRGAGQGYGRGAGQGYGRGAGWGQGAGYRQ